MGAKEQIFNFDGLVGSIRHFHAELITQASRAVNTSLTLRNWLIGCYIEEYERFGVDRAAYGDRLMDRLAETLTVQGIPRCDRRELYRYRRFYLTYPQIVEAVPPQLIQHLTASPQQRLTIGSGIDSQSKGSQIVESATPQPHIAGKVLVSRLSFTHIAEFINLDDDTKRAFYEIECIRGNWSVRELKRQIHSLYYERSRLSTDREKLSNLVQRSAEQDGPELTIRDPYIFEFLGLKPEEVMSESHLEDLLLKRLESFLLELGHGFCFEARQKRILIGDEHFFVDLVFYHRILKCHVLVELKLDDFNHEYIGQLNTYVSWYRKNAMVEGDNPPVGILLCTHKNQALVEYALAGMDNSLFVSRYLLKLPGKDEMQAFIEEQLRSGI
ncbi:MAG: PDDEXK nuclease domain-containing protein [Methanoculleus sp.]|nr:PDDEXK nuclease domain-containing protein [Methanoculleus sp.]